MILDAQNQFTADAGLSIAASTAGDNVISLGADRSLGAGEGMAVVFTVSVAAATGGATPEDYTFDVEYASDAAQTTARKLVGRAVFESTPTAPALDVALLVAGFRFIIPIMPSGKELSELFLGIRVTVVGTAPAGTISAHLVPMCLLQNEEVYANAITIS